MANTVARRKAGGPRHRAQLWATHDADRVSLLHEVPDTDAELDLVLDGAGQITGTVVNARGGRLWVHAQRADEPADARAVPIEASGQFRFDAVPPGDYTLRLAPPATATPTVRVVADETSHATLEVAAPTVLVTLYVPPGPGRGFVIEPASDGAGIDGVRLHTRGGVEESWRLDHVRPGSYRVSLDGQTWTVLQVDAEPAEQTIDLRGRRFA